MLNIDKSLKKMLSFVHKPATKALGKKSVILPPSPQTSTHLSPPVKNVTSSHLSLPRKNVSSSHLSLPRKNVSSSHLSFPRKNVSSFHLSLPRKNVSSSHLSLPRKNVSSSHLSLPRKNVSSSHLSPFNIKKLTGYAKKLNPIYPKPNLENPKRVTTFKGLGTSLKNIKVKKLVNKTLFNLSLDDRTQSNIKKYKSNIGLGASKQMQNKWKHMSKVERIKSRKKYIDTDGDRIPDKFDCSPRNVMRQDFKHIYGFSGSHDGKNVRTVMMDPQKFLDTTYEEYKWPAKRSNKPVKSFDDYLKHNVSSQSSFDFLEKAIPEKNITGKESKTDVPIPFLEFDAWGRPTGHEGRHTSRTAIKLGIKKIPVTIEQQRFVRDWEKEPNFYEQAHYGSDKMKKVFNLDPYEKQPVDDRYLYKPGELLHPKGMFKKLEEEKRLKLQKEKEENSLKVQKEKEDNKQYVLNLVAEYKNEIEEERILNADINGKENIKQKNKKRHQVKKEKDEDEELKLLLLKHELLNEDKPNKKYNPTTNGKPWADDDNNGIINIEDNEEQNGAEGTLRNEDGAEGTLRNEDGHR